MNTAATFSPWLIIIVPIALYLCARVVSHAWYAGKLEMIRKLTSGATEDNGKD